MDRGPGRDPGCGALLDGHARIEIPVLIDEVPTHPGEVPICSDLGSPERFGGGFFYRGSLTFGTQKGQTESSQDAGCGQDQEPGDVLRHVPSYRTAYRS